MIGLIKNLFGLGPKVDYKELIAAGAIVLDVRTKGEFASGSAKGAVNIPLDQLSANLKRLKDKNTPIITCCASGMRSAAAKGLLKSAGYTKVYNGGSWGSVARKIK